MNIQMNIHFNIHSVFKVFCAFRLDHVALQLLQGSKTPLETFSTGGYMFILLINLCTFSRLYRPLYNRRRISVNFSATDKNIVHL